MLSLILVVVLLFALYHIKKIVKFLSTLGSTDRVVIFTISVIVVAIIAVIYGGMLTSIVNYSSNIATLNHYQNIVAQLELELDEVNENVEHFSSHSTLTNEEIDKILQALSVNKLSIEDEIASVKKEIDRVDNCIVNPKRMKLYKFLLYFG